MIKFNRPTNLNGAELIQELKNIDIEVIGNPLDDAEGGLWLDIKESDKAKVTSIVATHNGTIIAAEPTVEQKLASVGLNLDDLKVALGL